MSFDASMMPAAPPPPVGGVKPPQGAQPAAFKLGGPSKSSDQNQGFLSTLDRVSDRKSGRQPHSTAGDDRNANRAAQHKAATTPPQTCPVSDQHPAYDQAAASAAPEYEPALLFDGRRSDLRLIAADLFDAVGTAEDGAALATESDAWLDASLSFLRRLLAVMQSEDQKRLNGQVGIGPFEQIQTRHLAQADHLSIFKQIAARVHHLRLATDRSAPQADTALSQFWHALRAIAAEVGIPATQTQALQDRVDALVDYLLKLYDNAAAVRGPAAVRSEANAAAASANLEAGGAFENHLFNKMTRFPQPTESPAPGLNKAATPDIDGPLFGRIPADSNSETAGRTRIQPGAENSLAAKSQGVLNAAEQTVHPNSSAENIIAKPSVDNPGFKPSLLRSDVLAAAHAGSKVIHIDGEAKDGGLFTQQEHLPEHLTKTEHAARSSEATQRSLTSQTMNQIVQKAVLLQNNGQHAVQIDLKPDFLGQIRMQIITESQQVTIRIAAELPFVKDMLESNLNQLKAELQAQGLQVDELEVSVAHDSRADDDRYQKAAEARRARSAKNSRLAVDAAAEEQTDRLACLRDEMAETAIDYFA